MARRVARSRSAYDSAMLALFPQTGGGNLTAPQTFRPPRLVTAGAEGAAGATWPASDHRSLSQAVLGGEAPFTPGVVLPLAALLLAAAGIVYARRAAARLVPAAEPVPAHRNGGKHRTGRRDQGRVGGVRVPGRAALVPVGVGLVGRRAMNRLADRLR